MKKSAFSYITIILLTIEISSCSTVRIRTEAAQPEQLVCKECHGKLKRWFWGYGYNGEFAVANCNAKALQAVRVKTTFWQGVVTVVTLGVYCPVDVEWLCAKEQ